MKIKITENPTKVSRKDIDEFCAAYKIKLPKDYYNFLLEFNGGTPEPNIFYYINEFGKETTACILYFIALKGKKCNLEYEIGLLEDRIPNAFLPIACDPSGNFILLGLEGENAEKVFFWDHELENENDATANMFPVKAKKFNDYINNELQVYEEEEEENPLNYFVQECAADAFEQKIKEDKNFLNATDIYGLPLSVLCIINNRGDLLEILIDNGISVKGLLNRAVFNDEMYDIVKLLIRSEANIDEKSDIDGYTPLLFAIKFNAIRIVELLLNSGANIEAANDFGQTIPVIAQAFSNDEMKQFLRNHKIIP